MCKIDNRNVLRPLVQRSRFAILLNHPSQPMVRHKHGQVSSVRQPDLRKPSALFADCLEMDKSHTTIKATPRHPSRLTLTGSLKRLPHQPRRQAIQKSDKSRHERARRAKRAKHKSIQTASAKPKNSGLTSETHSDKHQKVSANENSFAPPSQKRGFNAQWTTI